MAEIKKDFYRGKRISEKRKKLGMRQDEMAERIGICRQALSAIEMEERLKLRHWKSWSQF